MPTWSPSPNNEATLIILILEPLIFAICIFVRVNNPSKRMSQTKYIFVTGGVTSSLGKGIIAASLAKLLQARGYRTTIQKLDPYINVDPGTLNPYEHGECYVTDDGAETIEPSYRSYHTSIQ